jgi:hypothetical protein
MLVTLPSGAVAPLEEPGLIPLLSGGGGLLAVARATLAHAEVDAEALTPEDLFCVALWGLEAFADSEAATTLALVCEAFRKTPAEYLRDNGPLEWALDSGCLLTLKEARATDPKQDEPEDDSEGRIVFTTPDTGSSDD